MFTDTVYRYTFIKRHYNTFCKPSQNIFKMFLKSWIVSWELFLDGVATLVELINFKGKIKHLEIAELSFVFQANLNTVAVNSMNSITKSNKLIFYKIKSWFVLHM